MEIDVKNPIWELLNNLADKKGITEIIINGPRYIFVERNGKFTRLETSINSKAIDEFSQSVAHLNQKVLNADYPLLDGFLPDGSRINIVLGSLTRGITAITIRKHISVLRSFDDNPQVFELGPKWVTFIKSLISSKMNIMISGGTSSGKTTFLNLILREVSQHERIVCIEDTFELTLNYPNCVKMETKGANINSSQSVSMRDLVKNSLRMRPDRIVIGETRGPELFDLFQAMNTGHEGCLSTIHANSTADCFTRIETLLMMAGLNIPIVAIRRQIASALDFIIHLKSEKGTGRVLAEIREITGVQGDVITSQLICERGDEKLFHTGVIPQRMPKICENSDLELDFFNTPLREVS
ncbi:MAG: CpaF family protein [Halobacteriovoraceae bacterium]|nr:CpaF family protein [Halobacteriovoraceae bacterium]